MRLEDAIQQLDSLDKTAVICVQRPWSPSAECTVISPDENLGVPIHVKRAGFEYFLEVYVALEVVGVLEMPTTAQAKTALLLYYAENDAYPAWVYER